LTFSSLVYLSNVKFCFHGEIPVFILLYNKVKGLSIILLNKERKGKLKKPVTSKYILSVAILSVLVIIVVLFRLSGGMEKLQNICSELECLGPWAPAGFIGIYVLAVVLAIPGSALTALAGVLFGSFRGVVYVSAASTLGATLAFLIARYLARDYIYSRFSNKPSFQKLDDMSEKYGIWMVAIVRLVPVFPFNLVNYGLGLTRIKLITYVFFSWFFMLPGTFLYVAGGDVLKRFLAEGEIPWKIVLAVIVVAFLLYIAARKGRSRLK
jgi:uncharacterized membrane protein YdjX (TVP38/TMEM64 family)